MSTYQDVVNANFPTKAWALVEASGLSFAPYTGVGSLTGVGVDQWQQAGPFALGVSIHITNGKITVTDTLFRGGYWCQEVWVKPSSSSGATNRLVMELGANLAVAGSALYLPTGSNAVTFLGGGVNTAIGFTLPTSSWTLLQWGNLAGVTGEVDVAVNGQLIFTTSTSGFTGTGGIGFGGDPTQASTFQGSFAWPAYYTSQEFFPQWYSRYVASTDPDLAMSLSVKGSAVNNAAINDNTALLELIYAAVHRTLP